jgi:hypothetical protein
MYSMHGRTKNAYELLVEKPGGLADLGVAVSRLTAQN